MFEMRPCMRFGGNAFADRMGVIFTEILADMAMKVDDGRGDWPKGMMHTSTNTLTKPNYYDQMWSRDAGRGLFELARYGLQEEAESVCRIFVGGTWGKTQRMGTRLSATFTPDEVPEVIEKVMLWYKENGYVKERLGATVDRLGTEALEAALATNDLLDRKEEILAKALLER